LVSLRRATPERRSPTPSRPCPHDLLISFDEEEVRTAALTAMSLADRPRPKLLLLPGALRRHLYAFVWLPRDELTTARRRAIGMMLESEIEAPISSWTVELGEGELALIRFTFPVDPSADLPDARRWMRL
jgi:glutamate dehydrogenase